MKQGSLASSNMVAEKMMSGVMVPGGPSKLDPAPLPIRQKSYVRFNEWPNGSLAKNHHSYHCEYQTKKYHIVRDRNLYDEGDSIQIVANNIYVKAKLPSVKMNLQTNRPPNRVQLHDARFEDIDKEPKILSTVKKQKMTNFDLQGKLDVRHHCMINKDSEIGMQKYQINESITKKRSQFGNVDMSKHYDWEKLVLKDERQKNADNFETHDTLKAADQQLKQTSNYKSTGGGQRAPVSMAQQGPREFLQFSMANQSERYEKNIEQANDEVYLKQQR